MVARTDFHVKVNAGHISNRTTPRQKQASLYLFPVSSIFGHHFPQRLQHLDAQALLVLFQQLLGVFDQSGQGQKQGDMDPLYELHGDN